MLRGLFLNAFGEAALESPSADSVERSRFFQNVLVLCVWMIIFNGAFSLILLDGSHITLLFQTHTPFIILYGLSYIMCRRGHFKSGVSVFALGTGLAQIGVLYTLPGADNQAIVSLLNLVLVLGFALGPTVALYSSVVVSMVLWFAFNYMPMPSAEDFTVDRSALQLALVTTIIYTGCVVGVAVIHVTRAFVRERASRLDADEALRTLASMRDEELLQAHYAEQTARLGERLLTCRSESALAQAYAHALHRLLDLPAVVVVTADGAVLGRHPIGETPEHVTPFKALTHALGQDQKLVPRDDAWELPTGIAALVFEFLKVQPLNIPDERLAVVLCGNAEQLERSSSVSAIDSATVMLETAIVRMRTERRLSQIQRLDAVGRLSAGVVHDVNNLLTTIDGGVSLIAEKRGDISPQLESITAASARAASLTRKLLAFTNAETQPHEVSDISAVIRDLRPLLVNANKPNERFTLSLPDDQLWVRTDRVELEQAVLNLVLNARDATAPDGRIDVSVRLEAAPLGADHEDRQPTVMLTVEDDGEGMSQEVKQRAFEPFFSTRKDRGGHGLGLTSVYAMARSAGGEVSIDTEEGRGCKFSIRLPLVEPPGEINEPVNPRPVHHHRDLNVLLVEDDNQIRSLLAEVLRSKGHEVMQFADGLDARGWLETESSEEVDLVVSDVLMPRLGGIELAAWLKVHRPTLPVILMTGYSQLRVDEATTPRIEKPFTPERLLSMINQVMERQTAPQEAPP